MARDYTPKTWDGLASAIARDTYKKIGNKMARDISKQYQRIIHDFYADYTPKAYKRRYRSYFFAGDSWAGKGGAKDYRRFLKMDSDKKGFTIHMIISPGNLTVPYTSIKNNKGTASLTGLVFTNTWVYGQHGGNLPYDVIQEHLRFTDGSYENGWRSLKTNGWTWMPKYADAITSPSPMQQMDAWFLNYATNENLDRLTRDIVTQSINKYIAKTQNKYGEIK